MTSLPPTLKFFAFLNATCSEAEASRDFLKEEFDEKEASASYIDWLFDQSEIDVFGVCDAASNRAVFAAVLVLRWPCVIGDTKISYVPLVAINPALRKKGYLKLLATFVNTSLPNRTLVFPGDCLYNTPRVSSTVHRQRLLKYKLSFRAQDNCLSFPVCTDKTASQIRSFFAANGAVSGVAWKEISETALQAMLSHPSIKIAAFGNSDAFSHMVILQTNREDCVRVLWYAGNTSKNCLRFLKALSALFKSDILLDASHPLLLESAICEETEEESVNALDYVFYHNRIGHLMSGGGTVGLPCFI